MVHLREYADRMEPLADELPDDRRVRRRFKKVSAALVAPADADREAALKREAKEADRDVSADDETDETPAPTRDPHELLRAAVRERTRGRRLLFVSNRTDGPLEAELLRILEPERLDWCVAGDRQIASACARSDDVTYVRVFKGRPVSCLRGLARDLGLPVARGRVELLGAR